MADGIYPALTRQSGLLREMQMVAHNIANADTTGFRADAMIFSEYVNDAGPDMPSVSMALGNGHSIRQTQGPLTQTGGTFDFAIEGQGYFQVQDANGTRLTRAGSFLPNADGALVAPDGGRLLDATGTEVTIPANASSVYLSADGTLSADGVTVAQLGLVTPTDPVDLPRTNDVSFRPEGDVVPVEDMRVLQGFVEGSNVNTIREITRMIEVQRAYEAGQAFMDKEHERVQSVMRLIGR